MQQPNHSNPIKRNELNIKELKPYVKKFMEKVKYVSKMYNKIFINQKCVFYVSKSTQHNLFVRIYS